MPVSPKVYKAKDPELGVPLYGCEHIQRLLTRSPETTSKTIQHYRMILRSIFDDTSLVAQTSKSMDNRPITTLTPNFLCLQCPTICTIHERSLHGHLKAHMFYVDSQSGGLFCEMCTDLIWDPTLEELRLRKIGSGLQNRKRKRDELFTEPVKEDISYMSLNTTAAPCRAAGLRGIFNMGSTCFMSVILQSFVHNPLLRNFYLSDGHHASQCTQDNCLSCDMDELFQAFYSEEVTTSYPASNILSDSWLCQQDAYSALAGYDEHDAHEYFQFLCEELHRTIRKNRQSSPTTNGDSKVENAMADCDCIIHQTFYGKFQSTLTCQNCGSASHSVEPFLDLSLAIENIARKNTKENGTNGNQNGEAEQVAKPLTLQRCLDEEYLQPDKCHYSCGHCHSQQEAEKRLSIKNLPNVLAIQFKRFEHHRDLNTSSKIRLKVQFPLTINMLPYTNQSRSHDIRENRQLARSCTYDLLSVVVHDGSMNTGHYISYSRVGNEWFRFDDHKVTVASEAQVLGAEAFVLFYIIRSLA